MFGTADVKCRPLRLAYLVDPNSASQVREAIQLSSTLWGGTYFPIIPLYKRMPATWRDKPLSAPSAKSVILGLLDAFDPDVLVQFSTGVPDFVSEVGLELVKPAEVWRSLDEDGSLSPRFGIGIFELMNDLFDLYFKYKAKYPAEVVLPTIPRELSLFWASWFGEMPEKLMPMLQKNYFDPLEIKTKDIDPSKLGELLQRNVLFPRRIVGHGIDSYSRSGSYRDAYMFYMDATKVADIVDFWNLRAVGKRVLPLPKQLQADPEFVRIAVNFLKGNRRPLRHNKKMHTSTSIVRSRNSTMEEMEKYTKVLKSESKLTDSSGELLFSLQHWYPRIWDEWGRDKDFVVPDDIYGEEESSIELADTERLQVQFRSLLPEFAKRHGYGGEPRCANEITFRFYGSDEYIAEVFPKHSGEAFERAISGLGSFMKEWRVGRNGLVNLVKGERNETREVPLAKEVFFAWLKDAGWQAQLSASGLLAKQIYMKLEGSPNVLRQGKLLTLLEHMNGGRVKKNGDPIEDNEISQNRVMSVGEVKNRLASQTSGDLHDYLVSRDVFRLGVTIKCPHCTRSPWFPLEQIRSSLACPKCTNSFPAIGNLSSADWCYKTAGPFSMPNYAEGAYAVLLTVDFFDEIRMTSMRITPALSFTASANGKTNIEVDVGALWQESVYGDKMEGVLFAECKTYGVFEKEDFDRMRYLANMFPGSVLVFSTLREKLKQKEVKEITRIAKAGRKYWKVDRPINPVLILTGTELLDHMGPPHCWNDATKRKFEHSRGLMNLCDATQQMYLGLPSWHEEWRKDWEKKRRRRRKSKVS